LKNNTINSLDTVETSNSLQSLSRWSLISFCNETGQNIELKFVDKMKRQFQFSVDSFQIHLDELLKFYDSEDQSNYESTKNSDFSITNDSNNYLKRNDIPFVIAESMYGSFEESIVHLNNKLIVTKSPDEIYGGGLLKYCNLLMHGYSNTSIYSIVEIREQEFHMCKRFISDFSTIYEQEYKLITYLETHFQSKNDKEFLIYYLEKLSEIMKKTFSGQNEIDDNMKKEINKTLNMIDSISIKLKNMNKISYDQLYELKRNLNLNEKTFNTGKTHHMHHRQHSIAINNSNMKKNSHRKSNSTCVFTNLSKL
jgi:hypothetical protein